MFLSLGPGWLPDSSQPAAAELGGPAVGSPWVGFTVSPLQPADWDVQGNLLFRSTCCVLCWLHHYDPPAKETVLHFTEEVAAAQG